jgi:hypothetical protein
VTSDDVQLPARLLAWLSADDHDVEGWAADLPIGELRCHPDLVQRLSEVSRPVNGVTRAWVDGCPVVHHRAGAPLACARGTNTLIVRSGLPPGALASRERTVGLDDAWVDLDPWAADVTFAKTIELLRMHVRRAYDRAEAHAWR